MKCFGNLLWVRHWILQSVFLLSIFLSCSFSSKKAGDRPSDKQPPAYSVSLKLIASDLEAPVGMAVANDGTNRLFVIEQQGLVRIIKNGNVLPDPFLDLTALVDHGSSFYSEKGLLGIAFHPQYVSNGKFYVYYSAATTVKGMDHKSVIAEYTRSAANADAANQTGRVILEIQEPESNHNGGCLQFGPDGYLYIGVGDGGGAGDKHGSTGNGQNMQTLLGKILRIDINTPSGYQTPPDNPFVGTQAKAEIFALGLRNPWRFSFDRKTGNLFCGDVGQNEWEEVNLIEKGKNYGWRIMEGNHCYEPPVNCNHSGLVMPIAEYDHAEGKSITGGYVYRGSASADMNGKYVFADWTGKFFMLSVGAASVAWDRYLLTLKNFSGEFYVNSFGEDERGELYVLGQSAVGPKKAGKVYRLNFE